MYFKRCKTIVSLCLCGVLCLLMPLACYANTKAIITADNVNFRSSPNLQSNVISRLKRSASVNVIELKSDWVHIEHAGRKGWVSAQFIKLLDVPKGTGVVSAVNVNIRTTPSLDSKILARVSNPKVFDYYERSGDWYKIKLDDGSFGWIHKNFFRLRDNSTSRSLPAEEQREQNSVSNNTDANENNSHDAEQSTDKSDSQSTSGNTETVMPDENAPDVRQDGNASFEAGLHGDNVADKEQETLADKIIDYAKSLLGVRYKYGEMSPHKGFDCSGFTSYVFRNFGIKLERSSIGQTNNGVFVKRSQLQPGDLVFFDTNGGRNRVNHVGIYIGGGKFIHASSGSNNGKKVVISPLNEGFYNNCYMTARRVIGNK